MWRVANRDLGTAFGFAGRFYQNVKSNWRVPGDSRQELPLSLSKKKLL